MTISEKIAFCQESSETFGVYMGKDWQDYTENEIDEMVDFYRFFWDK